MTHRAAVALGLLALFALFASAMLAFLAPRSAADEPWTLDAVKARFPDPDAGADPATYVGNVECKECHEDRWKSLGTSFHAALRNEEKSGTRGCEECHGPGQVHYDEAGEAPIRQPDEAPAREANGTCLRCHHEVLTKPVAGHREWFARVDAAGRQAACVVCHTIHVDAKAQAFDLSVGPFPDIAALERVAQYVDPKDCIGCHPGFHTEMRRSGHKELATEGIACGECHGPGSLHALSGGDASKIIRPDRLRPAASNAICNACHLRGEAVQRWTCSEHAREGVACTACHDSNARAGHTLRGSEFELCGSCHLDVQAQFRLPNRHRVAEKRVLCSDCHDPHGNTDRVRDKDVRYRACLRCHQEKGGPFLFDHGIKRTEGCTACHEPHGSANRRLLTHTQTQPMCLQCHPETPHNLRDRSFRNCIACHVEIHGSDLDRNFRR